MEVLLKTIADFDQNLKTDHTMRISDEESNSLVANFIESTKPQIKDILARGNTSVSLTPVKTYVQQFGKAPIPGVSAKVVVPAFASHWGIVVGDSQQWLMHLVFLHDAESEQGTSVIDASLIDFNVMKLRKPLEGAKYVGETPYNVEELRTLGEEMITAFGDYHRVFWNCQMFAKCYLRVITRKPEYTICRVDVGRYNEAVSLCLPDRSTFGNDIQAYRGCSYGRIIAVFRKHSR